MKDGTTLLDTPPAAAADPDLQRQFAARSADQALAPELAEAREVVADAAATTSRRAALLEADLGYAERGWPTLPLWEPRKKSLACACGKPDCDRIGKHPVYDAGFLEHGLKDATSDRNEILRRRERFPYVNVAIATGAVSGLLVLDVDGDNGEASLARLEEEHGALPETYEVATGRGRHLYFSLPEGVSIRNSVGGLGTGLDVRGEGGYVAAPPSRYQTGKLYAVTRDVEPAELRGWLKQLLIDGPADGREGKPGVDPAAVLASIPDGGFYLTSLRSGLTLMILGRRNFSATGQKENRL